MPLPAAPTYMAHESVYEDFEQSGTCRAMARGASRQCEQAQVDPKRVDALAASLVVSESSRCMLLVRVGGGGLAALLTALDGAGAGDEMEAKNRGRKRRKRPDRLALALARDRGIAGQRRQQHDADHGGGRMQKHQDEHPLPGQPGQRLGW